MATSILAALDGKLALLAARARRDATADLEAGRQVLAFRDGAVVSDKLDGDGRIVTTQLPAAGEALHDDQFEEAVALTSA